MEHVRDRLSDLVEDFAPDIAAELRAEPPDDLSDMDDALEILQDVTDSSAVWCFSGGDLVLLATSEAEAA